MNYGNSNYFFKETDMKVFLCSSPSPLTENLTGTSMIEYIGKDYLTTVKKI